MSVFKKPKFWVKYSLVVLIAVAVMAILLHSSDPAFDDLEHYLNNSGDIKALAGDIVSYKVVRTRYVSQTIDSNRYTEYQLRIVGSVRRIGVDLRADYVEKEKDWEYSIVRFYDG